MSVTVSHLDGLESRQQRMWASGDYAAVAARIHSIAERLCETADLAAGASVLDVATGSRNAAIAAARCGCDVVGIDYVPGLLDRARVRARAEGLSVRFVEADAEPLPFAEASFDVVLSVVGVMLAPTNNRQPPDSLEYAARAGRSHSQAGRPRALSETCSGSSGGMCRRRRGCDPRSNRAVHRGSMRLLGGAAARIETHQRVYPFRNRSAEEFADFFLTNSGPSERAAAGSTAMCARHFAPTSSRSLRRQAACPQTGRSRSLPCTSRRS